MSEWRDLRREASFRGVPFWVDSDSVPVGRRTQLHEYPKRDQPLVEDMGRQTREYKFDGFIIGPDFISQRDRLLVALDTPGPGELVHPWFGRLTVTAGDCEISHSRFELGMVRFNLAFIDGTLAFPVQRVNTAGNWRRTCRPCWSRPRRVSMRPWPRSTGRDSRSTRCAGPCPAPMPSP